MWSLAIIFFTLVLLFGTTFSVKIDPKLTKGHKSASVIVNCDDLLASKRETPLIKETLENIRLLISSNKNTRTNYGGESLNNLVNQHQSLTVKFLSPVTTLLDKQKVIHKVIWVSTVVHIPSATPSIVKALAEIDIVTSIQLEDSFQVGLPPPLPSSKVGPPITGNATWNLGLTNTRCKAINCLGDGVVIGIIDTGVLWNHQEIKDNFKHDDYSWWDPFNPGATSLPNDELGHGTFVTGCAVGKNIGVAPNARWTACKFCSATEGCPDSALLECMQYMAFPWKWNDTTADKVSKNATQRPHVINMSLGGLGGSQLVNPSLNPYFKMVEYWNLLGIVSTFAAGNEGPGCATIAFPSNFPNTLSIGGVDANATIGWYSSRGPVLTAEPLTENSTSVEGASFILPPSLKSCTNSSLAKATIYQVIKPDIVAPGSNINSSWFSGVASYRIWSGTSFATPHVAGIAALVICANPSYPWSYKQFYNLLRSTADTSLINLKGVESNVSPGSFAKASNMLCNYRTSGICSEYPNNVYGKGLVNACRAVKAARKLDHPNKLEMVKYPFCGFEGEKV